MKDILKTRDLEKYDLYFTEPYNVIKNKYNMNCLFKKDQTRFIILQTPKLQLHSNILNDYVVLYICDNIKNNIFIEFMRNIENSIQNKVKEKFKKKLSLYSNIIDDNGNMKCIFNISNMKFDIYNENNIIMDKNEVEIYSDIICILKLQNIWVDLNKKKYGINWKICQIKIYPLLSYNKCCIEDSDDEKIEYKKEYIIQKCVFCNSICTYENNESNILIGKGMGKGIGKGMWKGKGKGVNEKEKELKQSGRGNKVKIDKIEKPSIKEPVRICIPSADELINTKNKLKKMQKIN